MCVEPTQTNTVLAEARPCICAALGHCIFFLYFFFNAFPIILDFEMEAIKITRGTLQ